MKVTRGDQTTQGFGGVYSLLSNGLEVNRQTPNKEKKCTVDQKSQS